MKRGTVVWVDLSDTHPPEMGKVRPGIVVSGAVHHEVLSTVVIVPTSGIAPEIRPLRLAVGRFADKDSHAVIPGIRQVRTKAGCAVRSANFLTSTSRCLTNTWKPI